MLDKHGVKDLGALRKHREKRRAKAKAAKGYNNNHDSDSANETPSSRTEGSTVPEFSPEPKEPRHFVTTIVTSTADREKMRKISKLGFEDPAERRRRNRNKDAGLIITTESAHEKMRKISVLGLEDPADAVQAARDINHSSQKGHDKSHRHSRRRISVDDTGIACAGGDGDGKQSQSRIQHEEEARTRSLSADSPRLLNSSRHSANGKDRMPRARSVDRDEYFFPEEAGVGNAFPPLQVKIPQHETKGPKHFGGVVETTKEKQQLMRKVSALGMYDPVFGNIHKDMEVHHASIVYEDMDFNHVPKEMRGLIGHTSEHTDPGNIRLSQRREADENNCKKSEELTFVPPAGSFVRRVSNPGLNPRAASLSPARPVGRKLKPNPRAAKYQESADGVKNDQKSISNVPYIPPTGSFSLRKRSGGSTPTRDILMKDMELATRAQSMFADDSLLAKSASTLELSVANLSASLGNLDYNHYDEISMESSDPATRKSRVPRARSRSRSKTPTLAVLPSVVGSPAASKNRKELKRTSSIRSWDGDLDLEDPMGNAAGPLWSSFSNLNMGDSVPCGTK